MCGIAGMFKMSDTAALDRMLQAITRRGPDSQGVYVDEDRLAMGMRRLAVLDVSAQGNQPMFSARGDIVIVYNGEVYNFKELRSNLMGKGHTFKSKTDTEVVLRMYEEYGDAFVSKLDGMFALAIYDKRGGPGKERVILARDPMGIKPLLFTIQDDCLIFASEMKAIIASKLFTPEIDSGALWFLLHKGSLAQPLSMLHNVEMLMPGCILKADANGVSVDQYWSFAMQPVDAASTLSPDEMVVWLRHLFKKTVAMQSVSDVSIGAWLSGGVDSALTSAFLSEHVGTRLHTFSMGVAPEEADGVFDETPLAEKTAQFIGSNHKSLQVNGALMSELFEDFVNALDQPSVDGVNSYLISRLSREHVTVTLSGTGGDELFAGYPWFLAMQAASQQQKQHVPYLYDKQYYIYGLEEALGLMDPESLQRIGDPNVLLNRMIRLPDELPESGPVERTTALCLRSYTQNQLLRDIDTVSMHHSLEVRVPFLGAQLVRAALALPSEVKLDPSARPGAATYRAAGSKKILFAIGSGMIPPDIIDRPKRGFGLPFKSWLLGPMREQVESTLLQNWNGEGDGFLSRQAVTGMWNSFVQGDCPWHRIWLLFVLRAWMRQYGIVSG